VLPRNTYDALSIAKKVVCGQHGSRYSQSMNV